ncbi:MAG: S41 family peptidase [Pseudomonadales bacterium]|nr:S41 family peptidase [Pseudomonadales bacterium]
MSFLSACNDDGADNGPVSAEEKADIVLELQVLLLDKYIFLDVAEAIAAKIDQQQQSGHYAAIDNRQAFADTLANDLYNISEDKHLRIIQEKFRFLDNVVAAEVDAKILDNNIGYLAFERFSSVTDELSKSNMHAALQKVINTQALIIDLRMNLGGAPDMVQYLQSHFYAEAGLLLNTIYTRHTDTSEPFYSLNIDESLRMADMPLYILMSENSFSAAEGLAYSLQAQARALIIGETSKGYQYETVGSDMSIRSL